MNKKKKKPRPRTHLELKRDAFRYYNEEMEEITEKFKQRNQNAENTRFYLFQSISSKSKVLDNIFKLAYFYDTNFTGNRDFMHIPNIKQITQNYTKYPIVLATQKDAFGSEEIIGVTTVKMEKNRSLKDNPFFPTKDEDVLSITGVLTKQNITDAFGNRISGVGKELFKSAIKGAYEINKDKKVRLVCEVDCRNKNSLRSVTRAAEELIEEGINAQIFITGYYEIINKENNLTEAPTFLIEIDLNGDKKLEENVYKKFSYSNCDSAELFSSLTNVIKQNTKEIGNFITFKGDNKISYHSIEPINTMNVELEVGTSTLGNERVPVTKNIELELVHA